MKYEDAGNIAVAPEIRRNCHVKLCWIQIRQIVEAERRVVAVYTLDLFVPIPGPQGPKDEVGPISSRKKSEPVDTAVLAYPVPYLHVMGLGFFGESRCLGLLGGKEPLLRVGNWIREPRGI